MPVFKRELAFAAHRPTENAGDWWHLVLDTDAPGLYVQHTWVHASRHSDGQTTRGAQRFRINDFLTLAEGRPAHPMLMSALREMFRDAHPPPSSVVIGLSLPMPGLAQQEFSVS